MAVHNAAVLRRATFVLAFTLVVSLVWRGVAVQAQATDVFAPSEITSSMLKAARWQIAHPNHAANDWTNGAFYAGVFAAWETTKDPGLMDAMVAMGESVHWQPGPRIDHADEIAIAQTYIDLYRVKQDPKMLQPTVAHVAAMRATVPGREAQAHGITWWWCDALFMGPPTLAKLGVTLNDTAYFTMSDRLFRETYDLLFAKDEHLFFRDATYLPATGKREANGRHVFWSRGNGWVAGGLVRLLQELPATWPTRPFYVSLYKEMMARVITLQQPDGLWRSSLLDPASYPGGEASGSGFYTYALAWGINNGLLDRATYGPAVRKAWTGLHTLIQPDGHVGWVQPIGQDPRKDFSPESWEVYGTGAYLLAGAEVIKLK